MGKRKSKTRAGGKWQNRIVGYGEKAAKEFKSNPLNWREHGDLQRSALGDVLEKIGWVTGVIENVLTGNLLDGHARVEEALKVGPETLVPFVSVDLSEEEERMILAVLDPIGDLATTDSETLHELIESIEFESDSLNELMTRLTSGHDDGDGDELAAEEDKSEDANLSDPNFEYLSRYGVIVECESELHQQQVFEKLSAQGLTVKVVVV